MSLNAPLPQGDTPNWGTLYNNAIQEIRTRIAAIGDSSISETDLNALRTQLQNLINSTEQGLQNEIDDKIANVRDKMEFRIADVGDMLQTNIDTTMEFAERRVNELELEKANKEHTHDASQILDLQALFVDVSTVDITASQLSQSLTGYTFYLRFDKPIPVFNADVSWNFTNENGLVPSFPEDEETFSSNRISLPLMDPNSPYWSSNDTSATARVVGRIIVRNPFNHSSASIDFKFTIKKYLITTSITIDQIVSQIINDSNFASLVGDRISDRIIAEAVIANPRV
jgi:hypothetical protein